MAINISRGKPLGGTRWDRNGERRNARFEGPCGNNVRWKQRAQSHIDGSKKPLYEKAFAKR